MRDFLGSGKFSGFPVELSEMMPWIKKGNTWWRRVRDCEYFPWKLLPLMQQFNELIYLLQTCCCELNFGSRKTEDSYNVHVRTHTKSNHLSTTTPIKLSQEGSMQQPVHGDKRCVQEALDEKDALSHEFAPKLHWWLSILFVGRRENTKVTTVQALDVVGNGLKPAVQLC